MTKPSITSLHGYMTDCDSTTSWNAPARNNMGAGDCSHTVENGDFFNLTGTFDDAGLVEWFYVAYDLTNFLIDSYPNYLVRWKTSSTDDTDCAHGIVEILFTDASGQNIFGTNPADTEPQLSATWTVKSGNSLTLTPAVTGKTVDSIRLFCAKYPDSLAAGTHSVYYDYVLFYKDSFTIPHTSGGIKVNFPTKNVSLQIPGRDGNIQQRMGMSGAEILLSGTMTSDDTWGSGSYSYGEYLLQVVRDDPWQWFTSDVIDCKVVPAPEGLMIAMDPTTGAPRTWSLRLLQYSLADLGCTHLSGRQWYGK